MIKNFNLCNDIVFKTVFASNDELSHIALKSFLEALLEKEIKTLNIINGEITSLYQLEKQTRFDITLTFNDDTQVDLEMQGFQPRYDLSGRVL